MRTQLFLTSLAGLLTCCLVAAASAATVNMTFDTVSGTSGVLTNTDGSTYYNEINGSATSIVPVSGVGQASVGNGSWQASAAGGNNTIQVYSRDTGTGGNNAAAFTGYNGAAAIRIRDIESFSFDTNRPIGSSPLDWNVTFYTSPDTGDANSGPDTGFSGYDGPNGDDSKSWYGRRMLFEPTYSYNLSEPEGQFNAYSTESGTNQLGMLDKSPGPAGTSSGFSGGPTLQDVQGGPVFWEPSSESGIWPTSGFSKGVTGSTQALGVDYRDEIVNLLRLQIGSPNNHPMLLDNFSFKLKETFDAGVDPNLVPGQTVFIDFEDPNYVEILPAVPEPSSLILLAFGALCLCGRRRTR